MKILLKAVKIVDRPSKYNGQVLDILIDNGTISKVSEAIEADADEIFELNNTCVSTGWCDMRVHNTLLGQEYQEDINTLTESALMGGFTDILMHGNTENQESLAFLKNIGLGHKVNLLPTAAATQHYEGKDIIEYINLHHSGAIAYTDAEKSVDNPDTLQKIFQYLLQIDGLFINHPTENQVNKYGQMHEGLQSNLQGLKGLPAYTEAAAIQKHINILNYLGTKSRLHFALLSTEAGVDAIRQAKKQGHKITCDVAAHNLVFTDAQLNSFDSNYKVMPPLRSMADKDALWAGLQDGTIDAVVSDHNPKDPESKNLEFDLADFGIIGLETVFAIISKYNKALNYNTIVEKLSSNPRKILGLPKLIIDEGQPAHFTLFQTSVKWTPSPENTKSKARNTPFYGVELMGKAVATINNGKLYYAQ